MSWGWIVFIVLFVTLTFGRDWLFRYTRVRR